MKTVGIRDLKNHLSEHLRTVRGGGTLLVTDRGEVVAEISPPGYSRADSSMPPGLVALARRGIATLGIPGTGRVYEALPRALRGKLGARRMLDDERGSR